MEALQRSYCGNSVSELCTSLENGLVIQKRRSSVGLLQRPTKKVICSGFKREREKKLESGFGRGHERKLASICHTFSTVSESSNAVNNPSVVRWRLDDELERLRTLHLKLKVCRNLREKLGVLGEFDDRVKLVFACSYPMRLATKNLNEYELYLLKCLVAIRQEHLLGLEQSNTDFFNAGEEEHNSTDFFNSGNINGLSDKNVLKGTFQFMTQLIESFGEGTQFPTSAFEGLQKKRPFCELHVEESETLHSLKKFVRVLDSIERFYDCIGGIVGYHLAGMELIRSSETGQARSTMQQTRETFYHVPEGKDLSKDTAFATQASAWGIKRLAEIGEIYPLGGAGDRLGLVDEVTGEGLPVAMLPYCGRTLLENLIRDLQAREFLHYKIYGKRIITPVAIMTSSAKQNHKRVQELLESHSWFGRGRDNFKLFEQPLVPTIAAENGAWLAKGSLDPVLKPGGHGVIWKLAKDAQVFNWFSDKARKAAVVRQISNPVAATDVTLLALAGVGLQLKKKLGFASCDRNVGAAEGVNVLMESRTADGQWRYGTTCIEYTEFNRLGIADAPVSTGSMQAKFPANTNVLFVDLESAEKVASSNGCESLPGMIMNLKKPLTYTDSYGYDHTVRAGRIECTMQNIADSLQNQYPQQLASIQPEELDTYILYNQRRKVTSSAKRRRKLGDQTLHQTPDGSFLDITRNAFELLSSCGVKMPKMENNHCYIDTGPPYILLFHPALGPLWDIIRQKVHGGSISEGSEVQLEIAELVWKDVHVDGSLLVEAKNVMGDVKDEILLYGKGCGRCWLQNVKVVNKGVDWSCASNIYWQNKIKRKECLKIILRGHSEFHASNVVFKGSHVFDVPDGHKMVVRRSGRGTGFSCTLEKLDNSSSGIWDYQMEDTGYVALKIVENDVKKLSHTILTVK